MKHDNRLMLLIFLVFASFGVVHTQHSTADYPRQCHPESPRHNVTFTKGHMAGIFTRLGKVTNVAECTTLICNHGSGDLAYVFEGSCFAVYCETSVSCDLTVFEHVTSAVTRLKWTGKESKGTAGPFTVSATSKTATEIPTGEAAPHTPRPRVKEGERGADGKLAMSAEHRLLQDVIYSESYSKQVRPALHMYDVLNVTFSLSLVQIVDVDEKAETIKVNAWTTQKWKDPFLQWNPTHYEGIKSINVEPTLVWLPVIILYNNAAKGFTGGPEKYKTKVVIDNNGTVTWFASIQFISSCKQNIRYFPFDEQYCYLKFGSWTYTVRHLDMNTGQIYADTSTYLKNGEWEILEVPVKSNKVYYECCPDAFRDITFTIHMRRKVLYYIFNLIIPTTIIVTFILVGFCLPPDSGERVVLNITVLLTMTVFLNIASNTLPSTSDSAPLLGDYYMILMIQVCFAILATCIVLRYYYAGATRMPDRDRVIINEWIASLLFFVITKKPKGKGIAKYCGRGKQEEPIYLCKESNNLPAPQSYIVQNENNRIEENIALIETAPRETPRVNGIRDRHPSRAVTSPGKSRSEPAINLSAGPSGVSERRGVRIKKPSHIPKRANALNTVQNRILEGMGVLTRRVKDKSDEEEIILEWQFAALVLDRLFFVIFFLTMLIPPFVFFFTAPAPTVSGVEPQ